MYSSIQFGFSILLEWQELGYVCGSSLRESFMAAFLQFFSIALMLDDHSPENLNSA